MIGDDLPQKKPKATGTIHTLPFSRLGWKEFEQLTLRLALKMGYREAEHVGATGSDKARDIVDRSEGVYFQCKNQRSLTPKVVEAEIKTIKQHSGVKRVVFVVGGTISSGARDLAQKLLGAIPCEFWCESKLDAMVKKCYSIRRDFFEYPDTNRRPTKKQPKRQAARTVFGSISVDRSGNAIESDERIAEILSEVIVHYENTKTIGRVQVTSTHLEFIQSKLEQHSFDSPDQKIELNRDRKGLLELIDRIERGILLLALSNRYSLKVKDKASCARIIIRMILELGGLATERSQLPLDRQGYTLDIFAKSTVYPRQLQIETSRAESEQIEKKVRLPIPATVMNAQSCAQLPRDFLWFKAYPIMIVASVWFNAYPDDDEVAAEKCGYDHWLFGHA